GIFPEAGLGLVHTHRRATSNGCTYQSWRTTLLVDGMAAFMNCCHQRFLDVAFVYTDGEANIKWATKRCSKGMGRLGNLAVREVIAHTAQCTLTQRQLLSC